MSTENISNEIMTKKCAELANTLFSNSALSSFNPKIEHKHCRSVITLKSLLPSEVEFVISDSQEYQSSTQSKLGLITVNLAVNGHYVTTSKTKHTSTGSKALKTVLDSLLSKQIKLNIKSKLSEDFLKVYNKYKHVMNGEITIGDNDSLYRCQSEKSGLIENKFSLSIDASCDSYDFQIRYADLSNLDTAMTLLKEITSHSIKNDNPNNHEGYDFKSHNGKIKLNISNNININSLEKIFKLLFI
jgi:hypothetical protein